MSLEKFNNIILIPPCNTYGDILSIISLTHFLTNYYNKVYLYLYLEQPLILSFYKIFFEKDPNFCKSIIIEDNYSIHKLINDNEFDTFHICNTHTGNWQHDMNNYTLYNFSKINKVHYFCDINPLYNFIKIDNSYICSPNITLPSATLEVNSIIYYKLIGLNNNVRMNYFNYYRNYDKELEIAKIVKKKFNIKEGEKYNIINTIGSQGDFIDISRIKKLVKNDYTCIDINYLVEFPGWLFLLIENAEELHLVEGFNVNYIYYSQYKNIINIADKIIYFHIWARNRKWDYFNLDFSWKMMDNPKLNNWIYVFNENSI